MSLRIDFYSTLKDTIKVEINPCLTREVNLSKLQIGAPFWNKRFGQEADLTKHSITEAIKIFGNESKYTKFREWYAKYKISPFLEGAASEDSKIDKKKVERAKDRGLKLGIAEDEIEKIIKKLKLDIVDIPTEEGNRTLPVLKLHPEALTFKDKLLFGNIIRISKRKRSFRIENNGRGTIDIKLKVDDPKLLSINPEKINVNATNATLTLNTKETKWGKTYSKKITIEGNAANCPAEIPIEFKTISIMKLFSLLIILMICLVVITYIPATLNKTNNHSSAIAHINPNKVDQIINDIIKQENFRVVDSLIHGTLDDLDKARAICEGVRKKYKVKPSIHERAADNLKKIKNEYIKLGDDTFKGGNYREAVKCYKEAVRIAPHAQDVDKVKRKLSAAQALS